MKLNEIKFLLILTGVMCFADNEAICQNNRSSIEDLLTIRVNPRDFNNAFILSEHVKSIRIVPLETSPNCLLGMVEQIGFINDKIIVLQKKGERLVLVFDQNGKFLYHLGRKGKGPEEYTGVLNFSVDEENGLVYLTDVWQQKLHIFNTSGNFIQSMQQEGMFLGRAYFLNPNRFLINQVADSKDMLVIRDSLGNNLKSFHPFYDGKSGEVRNAITPFYDNYHFIKYACDTVFEVSDLEAKPKTYFDFGSHHMELKEMQAVFPGMPNNKWLLFGNFWMSDKLITARILKQMPGEDHYSSTTLLYWRDSKEKQVIHAGKSDDIFLNEYLSFSYNLKSDEWISLFDPVNLIEKRDEILANKNIHIDKSIEETLLSLEENDNPVIVMFSLKEK